MLPDRTKLLAAASTLPKPPAAFEATWDGDSSGWYVRLDAVLATENGFTVSNLAAIQDGGDFFRLLNGEVPPWPEALFAREIGEELATRFGVPFYFPSPNHPETDCPHWWERDQATPCGRCGIPLIQRSESCPWRGLCYTCHLAGKEEKREASWSPEERAGPRCQICGNPAVGSLRSYRVCSGCKERYVEFECSSCNGSVLILKTEKRSSVCAGCDLRNKLAGVSASAREQIAAAVDAGGELAGYDLAERLLGWPFHDTWVAVREFSRRTSRCT